MYNGWKHVFQLFFYVFKFFFKKYVTKVWYLNVPKIRNKYKSSTFGYHWGIQLPFPPKITYDSKMYILTYIKRVTFLK